EGVGIALLGALGVGMPETPDWIYPILVYAVFLAAPIVVFMPVIIPLAVTWRRPYQVVIFRRFNTTSESKPLRRIASRYLGRFGHVFTLADSKIHKSLLVRIPVLLGELSFLHFRLRRIHSASGLTKLKALLLQRWRLNMNWLVSFRKIFPIQSS